SHFGDFSGNFSPHFPQIKLKPIPAVGRPLSQHFPRNGGSHVLEFLTQATKNTPTSLIFALSHPPAAHLARRCGASTPGRDPKLHRSRRIRKQSGQISGGSIADRPWRIH